MAATAAAWSASKSREAIPKDVQKIFERFDADNSGKLSRSEVTQAVKILLLPKVDSAIVLPKAALDSFMQGKQEIDLVEFATGYKEVAKAPEKVVGSILGTKQLPAQHEVWQAYRHKYTVGFVAACIVGNFLINIIEKEIDPNPNDLKFGPFWAACDFTFNIIFVVELWANMWGYGGPVREWWNSGWNVFDSIIVTVGVLTMTPALGPPLDKLKLMRAFRVFRLFKRIKPLNKIIVALIKSIPAVFYAFVVMFIFFCIYAILAVELFRDFGEGGFYYTYDEHGNRTAIDSETARGHIHGLEYYGTFMRALYTLFQVQTGELWSEAVARPLIFGLYQDNATLVGFFFVSFVILMQVVLINVVVAVLLDSFATPPGEDDGDAMANAGSGEDPAEAFKKQLETLHGACAEVLKSVPASIGSPTPAALPVPAATLPAPGSTTDEKLNQILSQMAVLAQSVAECRAEVASIKGGGKHDDVNSAYAAPYGA